MSAITAPNRLIVGCGYVGQRVAERWLTRDNRVAAFTRGGAKLENLKGIGVEPIVWDWLNDPADALAIRELSGAGTKFDTVLISVSHAPVDGVANDETHTRGLTNLYRTLKSNAAINSATRWIYLSTTGVFANPTPPQREPIPERVPASHPELTDEGSVERGDLFSSDGDHSKNQDLEHYLDVDETSAVEALRPGSMAALAAEKWFETNMGSTALANSVNTADYTILRPAGIYGPSRLPRWQDLKEGRPMEADPASYLNLIHVDDLAEVIVRVADRTMPHNLYCVSDLEPTRRGDYYRWIADFFGWPKPQFSSFLPSGGFSAKPSAKKLSRSDGNKRVRSDRLRSELSYKFLYPTFREGLAALASSIES